MVVCVVLELLYLYLQRGIVFYCSWDNCGIPKDERAFESMIVLRLGGLELFIIYSFTFHGDTMRS